MGFLECIRAGIGAADELRERVHSLVFFGSYVRGDFVEGVSDLDFFAVIREGPHDTIIPRLTDVIEECTENVGYILSTCRGSTGRTWMIRSTRAIPSSS